MQHRDTVLLFFQIIVLKADFYKEKCPLLLPFVRFVLNKATVGFDESQEGWEESWCKPLTGLCSVNGTEKRKKKKNIFCGYFLAQKTMLIISGLFFLVVFL